MTKVVFLDGSALQLENYVACNGRIEGDVVNGAWHATIDMAHKRLFVNGSSTDRAYVTFAEVEIPSHIAGRDYNKVIHWAEEKMERLQDLANRDMAAAKGMTLEEFKKWSEEQMFKFRDDDDIPF